MERNQFTPLQEQWLQRLERGADRQVTGSLYADGGFCCLGIATDIVDPEHKALDENEWSWKDYDPNQYQDEDGSWPYDDGSFAPPDVVEALHLSGSEGTFRFLHAHEVNGVKCRTLASLNDDAEFSFPEIAAFIREKPWLVFTNFDKPEAT